MEKRTGYMYGSTAPKLPERVEQPVERQKIRKKESVAAKPVRSNIPKAKMITFIILMVAISFVILYRFSALAELNYSMGTLNEELSQLRDENRMLEVDIGTSINLERVKEIAQTRLNMHKPESYQIVLVSVPKNNYSVVVDQAYINETTNKTSLMDNLISAVKAVLP